MMIIIDATDACLQQCYSLALEECDVEDGRIVVQKLKDKHFEDETVFKFRNSSRKLCQTRHKINVSQFTPAYNNLLTSV